MEVDWGPKFLENKQVDWGDHQHDTLHHYPCQNHRVSQLSSILVAISSSNPHLTTQAVVPSTFSHVYIENGEHSYGEHHHKKDWSSLMEIDGDPNITTLTIYINSMLLMIFH